MSTNGSGIFGTHIGALQKITGWAARKSTTRNSHGLNRSRYYVLAGDTLEKIADRSLGDPRFVGLLITINRPQVKMMGDDNARVPFIQPGQSIYLPTQEEMQHGTNVPCTGSCGGPQVMEKGGPRRQASLSQPRAK